MTVITNRIATAVRRIATIAMLTVFCLSGQFAAVFAQGTAQGAFTPAQYKKALWMVTRFYGAQRSGEGPNWLLMDHTYNTSFLRDADGNRDLVGGWFDCGDHVLFGQTFFYSAYMLASAYAAFPTGFHDLYHGKDYSDYAESGDYVNMASGMPNGVPDLLEELKYATDWIIKATPDGNTFYYEKGEGGKDHNLWVTAGKMSHESTSVDNGGQPRKMWKNPNDGPMASFAAATLAIMSKAYRKYDAAYADTCLNHAKLAYTYAKAHKNQAAGAGSGGYYSAGNAPANTFNIAAAEMFIATNDNAYKADISINKSDVPFHNWAFDYQNPHDIVPYAVAIAVPEDKSALLDAMNTKFITRFTGQKNAEKISTIGNADWGALRYPANHAFLAALYQGAKGTNSYDQFIYDQVDYILGKNNSNQSFIVGFCEGCAKQPKKPHHRNVYLNDNNPGEAERQSSMNIPARNLSFGYMVGGSFTSSSYQDDINVYKYTEGGLDYNAGLLGALAYIVSKVAPADTGAMGGKQPTVAVPTQVRISRSNNPSEASLDTLSIASNESAVTLYAYIFDENGVNITVPCDDITWTTNDGAAWTRGCIANFPPPSANQAVIASITVSYPVAGPARFISKTIPIRTTTSVSHKAASLSKNGYLISVKRGSVSFTVAGVVITNLNIYNIQGKRVFSSAGAHSTINWKSSAWPRGIYLTKMVLSNGAVVQKNLMIK